MIFPDSPLYDYFAVIGYNPAFGLRQEKISEFGDKNVPVPKSPLEATYEAKVIAHYPIEREGRPFAPEICSLAMPTGVRLYTEHKVPHDPSFHSFVVVREDGTRLHGCSLVFYEELRSTELRQQIFDAQLAYLRDFASCPSTSSAAAAESSSPDELHSTELSSNHHQQQPSRKFTTHSLPRRLSSSRRMVTNSAANYAANKDEEEHTAYYKNPKSPLFISKCMAVMTPMPVIYSSENLLHNIWMIIQDRFPDESISFEDVLYWTLHQIPMPPPGTSMSLAHSHFQLLVKRPALGEFPYFDYPLETLFGYLTVDKFLKLLTSFMLEKQILVMSKNARTLMLIAESLSALVFPFVWTMAYCPILPHTQLKFLEAPVPWLMGLCLENDTPSEEFSQSNICLLDIDSGRLEIPEDLPPFPRLQQISSQLSGLLKEYAERAAPAEQVHGFYFRGLHFNAGIRSIFIDHFASLFSSYQNYLLNTSSENSIGRPRNSRRNARIMRESSANFDKISFLVDQPESVLPFLSAFLETQMFTSFIDSKILSSQNPSEGENVHIFDRRIVALGRMSSAPSPIENNAPAKEYRIGPPISRTHCPPPKYHGFMPIPNVASFDAQKTADAVEELDKGEALLEQKEEEEPKQQLIMSTENLVDDESVVNQQDNNKNVAAAPMSLAHQNWKFVEQLLKETKAKTKRILVAKMGKEAIHLGHGQLHMGISGVEENTLVAAFCDLLERIWSHGLKKKQGKSALWAYIIAFHEFEKRASRMSSRRSSSIGVDNSSPESIVKSDSESPKTLAELISSIRRIAGTLELPRSRDNSPHHHVDSATRGGGGLVNNWSQSLLRAANVICEKIAANPKDEMPPLVVEELKQNQSSNSRNRAAAGLPPRPPIAPRQNPENQWRLFTPQLRRRGGAGGGLEPGSMATMPTRRGKREQEEENEEKKTTPENYRKFIYQGPLKAVNNQQKVEQRGREAGRTRIPRSVSSQPNGTGDKNLASHLSEDSLSRMTYSSRDDRPTPTRRHNRDLSSGPGGQVPPLPPTRHRNRSLSRSNSPSRLYERLTRGVMGGPENRTLNPLPNTMAYDLKNILRMTEIKTDIGFARAFVRLALERKLLYHYLKKLLSNTQLLQKMYKRYSFLRSDDEREQFLFHLLSLNAVDFTCFTNTFLTIKMRYQVLLVGSLDRFPDSLVYIVLTGSLGCTSHIFLPANSTQFTFDFKNLGLLSTLRVGHSTKDRTIQRLTKWYLDYVLVRNCVTAQTFYFRCGRWFGRGIDDGALERLLVGEAIVSRPVDEDGEDDHQLDPTNALDPLRRSNSPSSAAAVFLSPRKSKYDGTNATVVGDGQNEQQRMMRRRQRSPSCDRKMSSECGAEIGGRSIEGIAVLDQLQALEHRAGMAVNALMKHFLTSTERDQQNASAKLSTLLCAEDGLVPCIDEIFSNGLIQRIFQRTYPWDYVEKVFAWFTQFFRNGESKKLTREQRSLIIYSYKMVERIGAHNVVGKEGKFHLFVLLTLRDHIFSALIPLMAWTPVTGQAYEQGAFLRQPPKLSYLAKLIGSLNEFQFSYEKSLTHGIAF